MRIVMIGSGSVGKSALTLQYMYGEFTEDYEPTKADSYRKKTASGVVDILDTAGQEEYAAIRDNYYRQGDGFMFVYSITELDSYNQLGVFYEQVKRIHATPIIVAVGNKHDLQHLRKVTCTYHEQWNCKFFETSAKTGYQVEDAYSSLIGSIHQAQLLQKPKDKKKCMVQ